MNSGSTASTQGRLLRAAAELFSKLGYNGTSTRDIARLAEINEVTVYRYYPKKKDLFVAALESELQQLRFRADLVGKVGAAVNLRLAMSALIELIRDAVVQQPQLVRLLHFSVLEFGAELHPLYSRYLRDALDIAGGSLERWAECESVVFLDPRAVVLAFTASVVSLELFYPLVWGDVPLNSTKDTCVQLWSSALLPKTSDALGNTVIPAHPVLARTGSTELR